MHISENVSLRDLNSFGFDVNAQYYISASSLDEIQEALAWQRSKQLPLLILGGGSNTVFTRNVEGLVLQVAIDSLVTNVEGNRVLVHAGAGINWHHLVETTVFNSQYGLENLALIPGNAGAAPIQNIGAYGKEVCDNLLSVDVIDRNSSEQFKLNREDCEFDYRHSLFKTAAGSGFIVLGIELELSTIDAPETSYQALSDAVIGGTPDARQVYSTVCQLRQSKLPDPALIGNAGSFFKNPVLPSQQLDALLKLYPKLPTYPQPNGFSKVPAAWLIDQAGWKGHRRGDVGVHDRQALVLVNHGHGNGQQIAMLADEIRADIRERFDITLEREPVLY